MVLQPPHAAPQQPNARLRLSIAGLVSGILPLAAALPFAAHAGTLHVPADYSSIQAALDSAARTDTVEVACGTYYENNLTMRTQVVVRSETGSADCVSIDAEGAGPVFVCVGKTLAVLSGLTIRGGQGIPGIANGGGGLHCEESSIRVSQCVFVDNASELGGGIACYDSDVVLEECRFELNKATAGHWATGGGLFSKGSSLVLSHCAFVSNAAFSQTLPGDGGGVFCDASTMEASDCTFEENRSGAGGGGMYSYNADQPLLTRCTFTGNESVAGGGMYLESSYPVIVDCSFSGNTAETGGAMFIAEWSSPQISGTVFSQNRAVPNSGGAISCWHSTPHFVGCQLLDNSAGLDGGAIFAGGVSHPTLQECVLLRNAAASRGGAIRAYFAYAVHVTASTLAENAAPLGSAVYTGQSGVIAFANSIVAFAPAGASVVCADASEVTMACCDVFGNDGGDWVGCIASQLDVAGNFSQDPVFCDRTSDDLALKPSSPCAPEHSLGCGLVGALGVDCALSADSGVDAQSWGRIKAIYR